MPFRALGPGAWATSIPASIRAQREVPGRSAAPPAGGLPQKAANTVSMLITIARPGRDAPSLWATAWRV
ncbi:MAG: hypothetical protein MZU95_09175 [Desulfomicrobium escambiense]|nr:hypothetical protein [Desulfomicrobium escambiense]